MYTKEEKVKTKRVSEELNSVVEGGRGTNVYFGRGLEI
jgi:hypothetical protein